MNVKERINLKEANPIDKSGHLLPRPYLITRIWSSLLDTIFAVICTVLVELAFTYTLFKPLGYFNYSKEAQDALIESHLYQQKNDLVELTSVYQDGDDLDALYDINITYFYSNNEYAINDNKISDYNQAKLNSKLFEDVNGNINKVNNADDTKLKTFYEDQYSKACEYLKSTPKYYNNAKKVFNLVIYSLSFSTIVGFAVVHLIIPLCRKNGESPAKIINHMAIADARDDARVKKHQIVIRYIVLVTLNFLIPILVYAAFDYLFLIPLFATAALISITKSNVGPHEIASQTFVVSTRGNKEIPLYRDKKIDTTEEDMRKMGYIK